MWDTVCKTYVKRSQLTEPENICDIIDGEKYRELCKPGEFLFQNHNLTLTFNTDGALIFKSSRIDIWPLYAVINEIPPAQRFQPENVIIWGVWQGKGKPPTMTFLEPFIKEMRHLYSNGTYLSFRRFSFRILNYSIFFIEYDFTFQFKLRLSQMPKVEY